ncbi:hypothetical protein L207DRAFT_533677 [Hyaloscypha variabilis F]|uniref:RING-type domain-containing protein n=1 Tax=Hyaloscypha variabilis (strain UAMH 11265 / GT02V1 / F) TaxID=1149755 RepID=A0A2J6RAN0_HYAVF|nr:hypothetical protein L207DRAFT_533677 [Hyaloscypha variabilis F]
MAEYHKWWPKPRFAHHCTLSHVLHEQYGHAEQKLHHTDFHETARPTNDKWHDSQSVEAVLELREAQETCPCIKTLYLLQRGQCSTCHYYQQVPPKSTSILDRLTGKRDATLADRLDHSQLLSPGRKQQREHRLKKWRNEIEQQTIQHREFLDQSQEPQVSRKKAAFEKNLAALRIQEERDNVTLEDRIFLYDEEALYCEMLSPIEDQRKATKCCSCKRHLDGRNDELMIMPCGHTIHHLCFKKLFYSSLSRDRLQCPTCRRKYRMLMKPKFAVK